MQLQFSNKNYASKDGVLFSKDMQTLMCYPPKKAGTSYTVPDTVSWLRYYAFENAENLKAVVIPSNVRTLSNDVFFGCSNLTRVVVEGKWCSISYWENTLGVPKQTTVVCYRGSYAEYFAKEFGYTVEYLPESTPTPKPTATPKPTVKPTATPKPTAKPTATPKPTTKPTVSFKDVKSKDYFYNAVQWAVGKGITNGTSKTEFSPSQACTRAQNVTFLWRCAGQPEPKTTKNPFTDVKPSEYYYKAVLWAVENGITNGTSKTTFSPNQVCTRAQIVTFLWRYAKQPAPKTTKNPFTDLKANEYYYKAVLWAAEREITTGTTKTTFAPNDKCTRGQSITFLYRAFA